MFFVADHNTVLYRYCLGGTPLAMASGLPAAAPRCELCGAARVYELQLLPTLTSYLEWSRDRPPPPPLRTTAPVSELTPAALARLSEDERLRLLLGADTPLEVGNVVVYTCSRGCAPRKGCYASEFVIVQPPQ